MRKNRMRLKDLPVGSIITDKKTRFNNKPIDWLVADHEKYPDGTVLLSKDILCCRPFDSPKECDEDEYRKKYGSNRWKHSDIREWLNNEFLGKSFSGRLAGLIIPVFNTTELSRYDSEFFESGYVVDRTEEMVFLLSDAETGYSRNIKALELFKGNNKEKYLKAEVCPRLTWYWWLRSPYGGFSYSASIVNADGSLDYGCACGGNNGVRPACVISDFASVKKRKNGGYKFNWKEATGRKGPWCGALKQEGKE